MDAQEFRKDFIEGVKAERQLPVSVRASFVSAFAQYSARKQISDWILQLAYFMGQEKLTENCALMGMHTMSLIKP